MKSPPQLRLAIRGTPTVSHGHSTSATVPMGVSGHCRRISEESEEWLKTVVSPGQASVDKTESIHTVSRHVNENDHMVTLSKKSEGNTQLVLTEPSYTEHSKASPQLCHSIGEN